MKKFFTIVIIVMSISPYLLSQIVEDSVIHLTLRDAIELAQRQSPDILVERHSFRSSYWNYCYYKANYLPSVRFYLNPNFDHSIKKVVQEDGTSKFILNNELTTSSRISISQNIPFTGGVVSVGSKLERLDVLNRDTYSYSSVPVEIGYTQSLFGYNSLKWDKKIEPLKFERAKKSYVQSLESVALTTVKYFFYLASAQTNLEIARINYANADTLYTYAQGRYEIGTITENEMLQLEVSKLIEESNSLNARLEFDDYMEVLRYFLGIKETYPIHIVLEDEIPLEFIDVLEATKNAYENNPDILNWQIRKYTKDSNLAYAKASAGLQADISMSLGLGQTANTLSGAYKDPANRQNVSIDISFPILDWGRGKGRIQVAKSERDMEYTRIELEHQNFDMNLIKSVKQFNLQSSQLNVARKTSRISERRSEVARKLYLSGKSTILDLNASISERDSSIRGYISSLQTYWTLYYSLRSIALHDFEKNVPLTEDYEFLIK